MTRSVLVVLALVVVPGLTPAAEPPTAIERTIRDLEAREQDNLAARDRLERRLASRIGSDRSIRCR